MRPALFLQLGLPGRLRCRAHPCQAENDGSVLATIALRSQNGGSGAGGMIVSSYLGTICSSLRLQLVSSGAEDSAHQLAKSKLLRLFVTEVCTPRLEVGTSSAR